MRTTIDIDDDLLTVVKSLARLEKASTGEVVSRVLRENLAVARAATGFRPFVRCGQEVTNDQVNALREAAGI